MKDNLAIPMFDLAGEGETPPRDFTSWRTSRLAYEAALLLSVTKAARADYGRNKPNLEAMKTAVKGKGTKAVSFRGDKYDIDILRAIIRFVDNFKGEQYTRLETLERYALELNERGADTRDLFAYIEYEKGI